MKRSAEDYQLINECRAGHLKKLSCKLQGDKLTRWQGLLAPALASYASISVSSSLWTLCEMQSGVFSRQLWHHALPFLCLLHFVLCVKCKAPPALVIVGASWVFMSFAHRVAVTRVLQTKDKAVSGGVIILLSSYPQFVCSIILFVKV